MKWLLDHSHQRVWHVCGVWQTKNVTVPDAVVDYNKSMGGVDVSDALIGYDSVRHKTMKWYKTFFYHFMDIAVVNSFLLYKELYKRRGDPARAKPLTQKSFREQLAKEMVEFSGVPAAAPPRPPTPPPSLTCVPVYYGEDATTVRRYCRKCSDAGNRRVKTPVYCRKCQVHLKTSSPSCSVIRGIPALEYPDWAPLCHAPRTIHEPSLSPAISTGVFSITAA
ncbi:hypothetical protein F7725_025576, partial [Dissostichus mawsoni]